VTVPTGAIIGSISGAIVGAIGGAYIGNRIGDGKSLWDKPYDTSEPVPAVPDTPARDGTGKVHGDADLPEVVPDGWTGDDIDHAIDEITKSIEERKREQERLGEHGPHRERIRREEEFLRRLRQRRSNMGTGPVMPWEQCR
jgi:hypothetical protein